jgi:ATP-binding cassette, subfamily C, bacterial LapB
LSLLSFVDRLLLFEQGKLIADGPRDKVIAMLRGGEVKRQAPPMAQPVPQGVKVNATL